ncbi:cell surface protein SprA [Maribellus sp. YY47]|uniref:T9SS outer membrane translocon Sov/SprA n=1 Tax=Maribellus sp. YY47 TaxID=2929486 RepID=UPI002001BB31|nr:cell surface protein SprA [Maribellus sp. YY47]MCK3683239.1 cell surface protein SprA [Maribellus sp. YY47]
MKLNRSLRKIYFSLFLIFSLTLPIIGAAQDLSEIDTTGQLPYPFKDQPAFGYTRQDSQKLFLNNPSNLKYEVVYDPVLGQYVFYEKMGTLNYRLPQSMSLQDYMAYDFDQSVRAYWKQRAALEDQDQRGGLLPKLTVGSEAFNRIFGGNTINIQPQGYVEVSFGYQVNTTDNPSIPERLRKVPTFDFDQKIQMNVTGQIGTKMNMRVNYNTEATFDYENKMNIEYTGDEDEIIKRVEAGNVSLPLNGSLITGASNLFGVKTEMQFGKLNVTTIFSQHKGESKTVQTEGGAQVATFEISASNYDANRHFFLAQYFRDHYDEWLKNTAVPRSPITINKIEVWVTNKSSDFTDSRNILAFQDLGEHDPNIYNQLPQFQANLGLPYPQSIYPNNEANGLYNEMSTTYSNVRQVENISSTMAQFSQDFVGGTDFEKIEHARKLSESEYSVNERLGYISLNSALNTDEVLAVAFNFTSNGQTFQVGEFSTDGIDAPKTLFLKLLKGTNLSPGKPTWKLMMKNIYNLNAYQLTNDEFELNVVYQNDSTGTYINYLPASRLEGHILLEVMRLDMLNKQLDATKDGIFDYVEGITIDSNSGRIIFPTIEPFGKHLADSLQNPGDIERFTFQTLYDSTKVKAEQDAEHNKFKLIGSYKGSSSSDISLGSLNLAQGSVKVTAGGQVLTENIDYTVDYTLGTVKIINQALLEAGTPISVSTESEDLFTMQRKTLMGTYANYAFSDNFNIGGTLLYMQERPLTEKVDYGEDPISNLMYGFDARYNTESMLLTKALDALPFYSTNTKSSIDFEGEYAKLVPGSNRSIKNAVYIDDFEATKTPISLKARQSWMLASTPQYQSDLFPEGNTVGSLEYGMNRAKLAFYNIDPLFLRNNSLTPTHIKSDPDAQSNHYVREVFEQELFPEKEFVTGEPTNIAVLDLAYYPSERGPYNFDTGNSSFAAGVNPDGTLKNPETRWAGIMRDIQTSDFETANIEYIEFWLMDPFYYDTLGTQSGGDLYFNLGDISEDFLKDSRKGFEQGLPTSQLVDNVDTTVWGRVSTLQSLVNAFDNTPSSRRYQDIGFDGLNDDDEATYFAQYLEELRLKVNDDVYEKAMNDPSSDNFHYYRGSNYDDARLPILARYKNYNGPDGNSPTSEMSTESYPTSATTLPDIEDINDDNTLNEYERYYQYKVSVRKQDFVVGQNYITDKRSRPVELKNGDVEEISWYQFKIPVSTPDKVIGNISDFKSIRFMRMFMHGFKDSTVMRFATLDLVRAEWRRYTGDLTDELAAPSLETDFEVSAVSIEENGSREPVNYVLPPGVSRVIDPANPQLRQLNEQSMVLKATDLEQGDARAAYKSLYMDFRRYKTLKMDVHAEEVEGSSLKDDELYFFIRLGSDYNYNYYEYEIPLKLTPEGNYNNDRESDRYIVWPEENQIYVPLELFTNLKLDRNDAIRVAGSQIKINDEYIQSDPNRNNGKNRIKVKGSPNLGNVEVFMMGIRNRRGQLNTGPKSVEVWTNELRLSDFDDEGGWAANARVTARLADLGNVTVAGRKRSAGFGSIDQNVNSRSLEDQTDIDVSTSIDWGRFFPEKAGVRIPMYYGYSKSTVNPKYNPLEPDIELDQSLSRLDSKIEKDSLKSLVQDVVERKSINFTNVKVEPQKQKEKTQLWDTENFAVTYSYNETSKHNVNTEYNVDKTHRFMFSYNYSSRPKKIEPFRNVKLLQKGPLKLLGNFNFYPLPTQISYRTDLYRRYHETQTRNITNPNLILPATFEKDFLWNRYLDIRYDVTTSLKFDFSSRGTSRIDEPEGRINRRDDDYEWKRDSILTNLWDLGRPTLYNHTFNVNYQVPLRTFKALNFLTANVRYAGTYDWQAGPITDEETNIGNIISNSRNMTLSGNANLQTLFNKVPYFKEVDQKFRRTGRSRGSLNRNSSGGRQQDNQPLAKKQEENYSSNVRLVADKPQKISHKLNTKKIKVLATDTQGKVVPGKVNIIDPNTIEFTPMANANQAMLTVSGKRGDQPFIMDVLDFTTRVATGVRTINVTYSKNGSTVMPGYLPEPALFGGGRFSGDPEWGLQNIAPKMAPGLPFLMGWQDRDFAVKAAENGWLTIDSTLNQPFMFRENERINLRVMLEPLPDLRIDLTGDRSISKNITEFYDYDTNTGLFNANSFTETGNFSMSTLTWGTAFFAIGKGEVTSSKSFEKLKEYRAIIANRLAQQRGTSASYNPNTPHSQFAGYPDGYGPNSVEVLVPAFLAAYQDKDPNKVSLSLFPSLKYIRPNWSIRYEGMVSRIPGLNKVMRSLNFQHTYRSSYNVGSFVSNLNYLETGDGFSYIRDLADNFVPSYDFNSVSIIEAFNPLINVDVMWQSDFTTRGEIKRSRNLNLSFANNQLTEVLSNEYIIGLGYRFTHMDVIIKTKNSQQAYSNDLNIRADISYRRNKTILRQLDSEDNQITAGQGNFTIKTYADYRLSDKFEMRVFYDRILNNPFTSLSYRTTNANFGVSFRFTLAN